MYITENNIGIKLTYMTSSLCYSCSLVRAQGDPVQKLQTSYLKGYMATLGTALMEADKGTISCWPTGTMKYGNRSTEVGVASKR